jgi:hypothetical protein
LNRLTGRSSGRKPARHENEITRLTLAMGDTPVCSTGSIRHFPPHVLSSSRCILRCEQPSGFIILITGIWAHHG